MKFSLSLVAFVLLQVNVKAQIISTFAGNGQMGNTGDGGLATNASINYPTGSVFDKNGSFYFGLGLSGNSVRKVSNTGVITTIAGTNNAGFFGDGGLAINAELSNPTNVALDTLGNIFICDNGNDRIRKIDISTGIITTVAGNGNGGFSGDGSLAINAEINYPGAIACDKAGNIFIADAGNHRIRKVDPSGIITTIAGNGTIGYTGDGGPAILAQITAPQTIFVDDSGNIYISVSIGIRKINTSGIITTVAGNGIGGSSGDGGLATNANVSPGGGCVVVDKLGNIYFPEPGNHKIRKVDHNGIISTIVGNGNANSSGDGGLANLAEINYPAGLGLDSCGNLYISEAHGRRIRKVSFNPNCWPLNVNTTVAISFSIYPNPAQTQLTITSNNATKEIIITNALGQQVLSQKTKKEKTLFDVSSLAGGVYFVTVSDESGAKLTKKIVINGN